METTFHFLQSIAFIFFCVCISLQYTDGHNLKNTTISCSNVLNVTFQSQNSLSHLIQDYAFKLFMHHKTGIIYDVKVPLLKCGFIEVNAVRLRTGRLRSSGLVYNEFEIPPGIVVEPPTDRLVLVYHQLGNGFSNYYSNIGSKLGYRLVAPVFGLLAYDFSSVNLDHPERQQQPRLWAGKKPIKIRFKGNDLAGGTKPICILFDVNGTVSVSSMSYPNVCITHSQGQFSLAVPNAPIIGPMSTNAAFPPYPEEQALNSSRPFAEPPLPPATPSPPPATPSGNVNLILEIPDKSKKWKLETGILVGGFVVLGMTWMLMLWLMRQRKKSRFMKMENEADQGEALQIYMYGFNNRAPAASGLRTQPMLETEYRT